MSPIFGPSSSWAREALAFGLDVALKATIVGLLALALHGLLGRRRVLVRSVLWHACLAGLLVLPGAVAAFPRVRIACLPPASVGPTAPVSEYPALSETRDAAQRDERRGAGTSDSPTAGRAVDLPLGRSPETSSSPGTIPTPDRGFDAASALVWAYGLIVLLLGLRLAGSLVAVARLRHSNQAIEEGPWAQALEGWQARLGPGRRVRLARSGRLDVPVVVGWWCPTILVPDDLFKLATAGAIDAVLLHELAHVRRGDYAANLVLRLVQALYWPHPLAWILGRVVAGVREQACDDMCIYWMGDARDYRATLLGVAEGVARRPRGALGLAMTRSTKLGRRLAHIARSPGTARCLLRWPARMAIACVVVAGVAVLGSVQPTRNAVAAPPDPNQAGPPAREPAPRVDDPKPPAQGASPREGDPSPPKRPGSAPAEPRPASHDEAPGPPVQVTVIRPRRKPWTTEVTTKSTLKVLNPLSVHSRVAGSVRELDLAAAGDRVKKDQLIARIDPSFRDPEEAKDRELIRQAEAKEKQARIAILTTDEAARKASVKQMRAQHDVEETLVLVRKRRDEAGKFQGQVPNGPDPKISEAREKHSEAVENHGAAMVRLRAAEEALSRANDKSEAARADLRVAEVEIQDAKDEVESRERTREDAILRSQRVQSPIDGLILKRNIEPGGPAVPDDGKPLFVVARTDVLTVPMLLPESDALLVDPDDPVQLTLSALPNRPIKAGVTRIGAEVENGKLPIEIDIPNPDGRLRPGMSVLATIVLEPPRPALVLPQQGVLYRENSSGLQEPFCYRVIEGKAAATPLKLGDSRDGRVEVLAGLDENDRVISDLVGNGQIRDGQPVEIVDLPQPNQAGRGQLNVLQ